MQIDILNNNIHNCTLCDLRKNVCEFSYPICGIGDNQSKIMMVNQFTNKEQMLIEEPLDIKHSAFLRKHIDTNNIYVTTLVRCPSNTQPSKNNIQQCSKWLLQEINILKPKYIIGMGKNISCILLNCTPKTLNIDKNTVYTKMNVMRTYTTSYIYSDSIHSLMNGSNKNVEDFFSMLKRIINEP